MTKISRTQMRTDRYHYRYNGTSYWITVIETATEFEAWIQKSDEGIAALMFGIPKHQANGETMTYDGFIELIDGNLDVEGPEVSLEGVR